MRHRPFSLIPTIASDSRIADRFQRMDNLFSRLTGDFPTFDESLPAYNIKQINDQQYQISLALPGFSEEELSISLGKNQLIIEGNHEAENEQTEGEDRWLHRGIQKRSFSHQFTLNEGMKVKGATLDQGLLTIDLEQEAIEEEAFEKIAIENRSR